MASALYRFNQLRAWVRYPSDASAAARLLQLQSLIEPPNCLRCE